jgi:hypothetical protein
VADSDVVKHSTPELSRSSPWIVWTRIPFRYTERQLIEADLRASGFSEITIETVSLTTLVAGPGVAARQ